MHAVTYRYALNTAPPKLFFPDSGNPKTRALRSCSRRWYE